MRKSALISKLNIVCILILAFGLSACASIPDEEARKENGQKNKTNEQQVDEVIEKQEEQQTNNDTTQDSEKNEEKVATGDIDKTDKETPEGASEDDNFDYTVDSSSLSNEAYSWSWKRNSTHQRVVAYNHGIDLEKYGAYYQVDTDEKVIYLTFDEGYENGYTYTILDILKENDVQAAFFVTKPYIESSKDLCIRMVEEGHIVANHSVTHSSFPELSNEQIKEELEGTASAFKDATGYEMAPFFRTPSGKYSERVLNEVRKYGYKSIFWSLAYGDWDVNNQPGAEYVYNHIMENHHPGGVFLLHAVSKSNTEALDGVLKALKAEGYRFGSLYELE